MTVYYTKQNLELLKTIEELSTVTWPSGDKPTDNWDNHQAPYLYLDKDNYIRFGINVDDDYIYLTNDEFIFKCMIFCPLEVPKESKVKDLLKKLIANWEELSPKQKAGLIIIATSLVMTFTYAGATGFWFMNPLNPVTWAGGCLRARLFYMLCGATAGYGTYLISRE